MVLLDMGALVAPGWIALAVTAVLGACIVFLFFNMRKQMRNIDLPVDQQRVSSGPFSGDGPVRNPGDSRSGADPV
ncbi:hypothetical protein [Nigerium massiliense]|uniref:hypothetical protein n=1 Tax=Nigerium massiliense TaxID=1522317 RepID=UPI00058DF0AD|nr:hypothetical protein [Nigerium massiliense]